MAQPRGVASAARCCMQPAARTVNREGRRSWARTASQHHPWALRLGRECVAQCTTRPHTPRPMERPCRLVLVGMMGSGKTTVGRLLAKGTGWRHADNDELLHELVGKTPRELLAEDGEDRLRESESAALRLGLQYPEPSIV